MNPVLEKIYRHPELSHKVLQDIIDTHTKVVFAKGDSLLSEGDMANEYYCMESGFVRSFAICSEGDDITTGFYGPSEIVIEVASIFLRIPTKENFQALTDCTCWKIKLEDFQQLFESKKGFSEWGRSWMSGILFMSKQRSLSMITDSATERYLSLLKEQPGILHHAPLKHIATYLGITDTSLSRIRKEVSKEF